MINKYKKHIDFDINFLIEASFNDKNDKVINYNKKRLYDYMKQKIQQGDSDIIDNMTRFGLIDIPKKEAQNNRERLFKNLNISKEVSDDILRVSNILSNYMNNGSFNSDKCKKDFPDEYNEIMRIKNFIDLIGLTAFYDKTANQPSYNFGVKWLKDDNGNLKGDFSNFDFNNITDSNASKYRGEKNWSIDESKYHQKKAYLDKYMSMKYGMGVDIPDITFSNGNAKLPKDMLIINFTSALSCPAWNECLIKHSCYARADEKRNPSTYYSNNNRSFFWVTTKNDDYLMKLLMDFIKCYCFNFTKIAQHLISNKIVSQKNVEKLANEMSKKDLNDSFYTPEIIDIMKMYKRINYIRLNEAGDFIGQWLVDAWDNEAGKYETYDISVSAYTCRLLNYDNIKHIILNASYTNKKSNVSRRFIALPHDVYDALDDTYVGSNNKLTLTNGQISVNPQPLYDLETSKPNGKVYYKCPCGVKIGTKDAINCYNCKLCYQPHNFQQDMFVFVKAHGSSKMKLNGYDIMKHNIGVSKNFKLNYKSENNIVKESNETNYYRVAENNGINGIVNNAISSVNEHLLSLK